MNESKFSIPFKNLRREPAKAVFSLCALAACLAAQSYQGGVRGSVMDQQGAVVPNVRVTLTNEATSVGRSTLATANGTYVFSDVDPAKYTVSAESPGFKKYEQAGIVVGTQEFLTVDLKLEVGSMTQSVTVTEEVPLVESSNASQGQVIDNQQLTDLPNLGRNPFMMSKVAQNVMPVGDPAYNRMEDQSGSSQISIAGGPVRGNNYLLDGVPITDADNRAMIIPTIEAVQEVKIQANTYDAEMARTGGGMFNTFLKSGTNAYHGVLFGSTRQTGWSGNNFFNNAAGLPLPPQWNYTYAAAFGGRVWIPKLYDGKNKTFFWIAREGYDDTQSNSSQLYTPTALERQGNFSQSYAPGGGLQVIYNPASTVIHQNGTVTRSPFPGNVIPSSMLNPVGLAIANTLANPSSTPAYYGANDLTAAGSLPARAHQTTFKLDENFTDWWHANLSYLSYLSLEPGNTWFNSVSSPDQWRLLRNVNATQLNNVLTLSPTVVLSIRYGFNRFPNYGYQVSSGFNLASLGFSPTFTNEVLSPTFPVVGMSTVYNSLGGLGTNNDFDYVHYSYNFSTSVSKYLGRHSLTAGFDYRRIHTAGLDYGAGGGDFNFNGVFTEATPGGAGGADLADMLLGFPHDSSITVPTNLNDYATYYGIYAQDDFRLNSKITLNFGLRWERELGLAEEQNGLVTGFEPTAPNPIQSQVSGLTTNGIVEFAGVNGAPTTIGHPDLNKWGPRAGIAWQLDSKTVVRGGYGLFWAPPFALGAPIETAGYYATTSENYTVNGYATPDGTLTNPFPSGLNQPTKNTLGALAGVGQSITFPDPSALSPRVQQFSIDVQRELPFNIALEVGYVGSRSDHLTTMSGNININALNPSYFSQGYSALTQSVANPLYGAVSSTSNFGGPSVGRYQLLLPYPQFGEVKLSLDDQDHAKYDSLVVKAQKRFSNGLTFLSTFTWARTFDEGAGGPGNFLNNGGNAGVPQNPYNVAAEWAPSYYDAPLRWATTFSYDLPFGKGQTFLSSSNKWVDAAVGGWSLNAITIYQSGFPLQITQSPDNNSLFGYDVQRPNATGISPGTSGSVESRLGDYINSAAFSLAPALSFGNVARSIGLRGPGQANWDLSLFKNMKIGEKFNAQFRTSLLNAFNTPLFNAPSTTYGTAGFGVINSQANFSRMVELGLRLYF